MAVKGRPRFMAPYFPETAGDRWQHFSFRVEGTREDVRRFVYTELCPALDSMKERGLVARSSFLILSNVTVYLKASRSTSTDQLLSGLFETLSSEAVKENGFALNEITSSKPPSTGVRVGDLRGHHTIDMYLWRICRMHADLWNIRDESDPAEVGLASIPYLLEALGVPSSEWVSAMNRWIDDFSYFCVTNEDSLDPDRSAGAKVRESLKRAPLPQSFLDLTKMIARGGWRSTPTQALAGVFLKHERNLRRIGKILAKHRGETEFFPEKFPWERAIFCNYIHFHLFNIGWNGDRELLLYWALAESLGKDKGKQA